MSSTLSKNSATPGGFVITRQPPRRKRLLAIMVGIAVLVSGGLAAWVAVTVAIPDYAAAKVTLRETEASLEQTADAAASLSRRVAWLEREVEVTGNARAELLTALTEKQTELARVKADLSFYQRLVGEGGQREGLSIHSLQLAPTASQRVFRFEITLSQNLRRARVISGQLSLVVEGISADQPARLTSDQLLDQPDSTLPFQFKYFQLLDGNIVLPEGFIPERIIVNLLPDKLEKGAAGPAPQTFAWQAAITGVENV